MVPRGRSHRPQPQRERHAPLETPLQRLGPASFPERVRLPLLAGIVVSQRGRMEDLVRRLAATTEAKRVQFGEDFEAFAAEQGLLGWEGWFHPYDEDTYQSVLQHLAPADVVLEIGAGDLRLSLWMAQQVQRVYAVEVNPRLFGWALREIGRDLPGNLHVLCANALHMDLPPHLAVAVLLMRHCAHFCSYFERLQAAGCQRLITNARWKSGVEVIDLTAPRIPFAQVREGWYACRCGAVGYVGQGERPQAEPVEVFDCPACRRAENGMREGSK